MSLDTASYTEPMQDVGNICTHRTPEFADVSSPVEPLNEAMLIAAGEGQPGALIGADEVQP